MLVFALLVGVFAISLACTGWLSVFLRRHRVMDIPGERSSHAVATPRGGGLAIAASVLIGTGLCVLIYPDIDSAVLFLLLGAVILAGLSWIDDLKSLPPALRFAIHAVIVALSLPLLGLDGPVLPFDPPLWLDRLLLGLGWLGFLNFFNFMDGINGISVVESVVIGAGIILLHLVLGALGPDDLAIAVVLAASIGFGWWNWGDGRIFMGDVGSVFLGYLLGGYLILLAGDGYLAAALILPAYYLIDATVTLVRRALRGERVWQAHRQHFYQRAVLAGRSHAAVSLSVYLAGLVLIALAAASLHFPIPALAVAIALASAFCLWLPRPGSKDAD